jgi:hypothetical protein
MEDRTNDTIGCAPTGKPADAVDTSLYSTEQAGKAFDGTSGVNLGDPVIGDQQMSARRQRMEPRLVGGESVVVLFRLRFLQAGQPTRVHRFLVPLDIVGCRDFGELQIRRAERFLNRLFAGRLQSDIPDIAALKEIGGTWGLTPIRVLPTPNMDTRLVGKIVKVKFRKTQ